MYKATGKVTEHGNHLVLGVSLEYGKGKKQEVFMVAKQPEGDHIPGEVVSYLLKTENNDNRFFGSQMLAGIAAAEAWKTGTPVKNLSNNFSGRDPSTMTRHLQLTATR